MTLVFKASGPADLLAMVPVLVGFRPRNSVVLVAFRGERTCGAMRFDLPVSAARALQKRVVSSVIGTICKLSNVDAMVPVIYTDDAFAGTSAIPQSELAELLGRRIEQSGFELRASICQASDGWASYFETAVPAGGHPLDDIAESSVAAAIPDELRPPGDDDLARRVADAEPRTMTRMGKRLAEYRRLLASVTDPDTDDVPAALDPICDLPIFAEAALEWDAAALEEHGALLVFALQGPPARDLVMLQWAAGLAVGDQIWDAGAAGNDVPDVGLSGSPADHSHDADLGDLMMGIAPRPDPVRIHAGIALLLALVAQLADKDRPPLLCMLAWLNWALGRGTRAGRHLDEALSIDPSYSMAQLLDTMLGNGMLPEWAFSPSAGER